MQWMTENTRNSGEEDSARLYLILTKEINLNKELRCVWPIGKSDHVIIDIEVDDQVSQEDVSSKQSIRNYGKNKCI